MYSLVRLRPERCDIDNRKWPPFMPYRFSMSTTMFRPRLSASAKPCRRPPTGLPSMSETNVTDGRDAIVFELRPIAAPVAEQMVHRQHQHVALEIALRRRIFELLFERLQRRGGLLRPIVPAHRPPIPPSPKVRFRPARDDHRRQDEVRQPSIAAGGAKSGSCAAENDGSPISAAAMSPTPPRLGGMCWRKAHVANALCAARGRPGKTQRRERGSFERRCMHRHRRGQSNRVKSFAVAIVSIDSSAAVDPSQAPPHGTFVNSFPI